MSQVSSHGCSRSICSAITASSSARARTDSEQSKHAVELCALLVDETYGELTSVCVPFSKVENIFSISFPCLTGLGKSF
jgi:hypothetical protein